MKRRRRCDFFASSLANEYDESEEARKREREKKERRKRKPSALTMYEPVRERVFSD